MDNPKAMILNSFLWKFFERFSVQGFQFVVQIVLARLLLPEEYGSVAVVAAVIAIMNVMLQAGVNKALVQFNDIDSVHCSTAFYWNIFLSVFLYIILIKFSPALSKITGLEDFYYIARVLGINLIISVFNGFQDSLVIRQGKYKILFISSTVGIIVSGITAIIFALNGYGLWSLVIQQLSNQFVCALSLRILTKNSLKLQFSFIKLKKMLKYSWKISISSFIDVGFQNIQSIILGSAYNMKTLGYVGKGQQFPLLIITNIENIIQPIMFREFSLKQKEIDSLKLTFQKVEKMSAFLLFPILSILIVNAKYVIEILLTERWSQSTPFLVFFTLAYMLIPFSSLNIQVLNALGKTSLYLRNEVIKKICGLGIIIFALRFGVEAFCVGLIFYGFFCFFIDSTTTGTLINVTFLNQIWNIGSYAILSFFVGLVIYPFRFLGFNSWLTLLFGVISGIVIYLFLARQLNLEGYFYMYNLLIKNKTKK